MNDTLLRDLDDALRGDPPSAPRARAAYWTETDSPIGPLFLATGEDGRVRRVSFSETSERCIDHLLRAGWLPLRERQPNDTLLRQLDEYFDGKRQRFDLEVDLDPLRPFHRAVLEATARLPFGAWSTYGGLALEVGAPRAARAVGNALGDNPVPLIVPCHRVLAAGPRIGGYARNSPNALDVKRHLLRLEGVTLGL